MPAPQAAMMQELAKTQFRTFAIKVPNQPPLSRAFLAAAKPADRSATPAPMPPALFLPDSSYKTHVDTQKHLTDVFGTFLDDACSAVCGAWDKWQRAATLVGVVIAGPVASLGKVVGPPLMPLILAAAPAPSPSGAKFLLPVAKVIGAAWETYCTTIKVPGLPWYPAFAACPSPIGPPTPNLPCPVAALTQLTTAVSKPVLKAQLIAELDDATAPYHVELFDSLADAFEKCFTLWQTTTLVTNVIGTGPVPAFAPPAIPAGPVVGGVGNMKPGGFV